MDIGVQGKTVLVTGSSGDIGRATARLYGQEGANVIVTYYKNKTRAEETAQLVESAGGQAKVIELDVTRPDSVAQAVSSADDWAGVDILIITPWLPAGRRSHLKIAPLNNGQR